MILHGISYERFARAVRNKKISLLAPFVSLIEEKLGAKVVFDLQKMPFERADIIEPLTWVEAFKQKGVLRSIFYSEQQPDEVPFRLWRGICNDPESHSVGGASFDNDVDALFAVLGESLERYIWYTRQDYFDKPIRDTAKGIARRGPCIAPERFVSFSKQQRADDKRLTLDPNATYTWIRGTSLVSGKKTYLPAQTLSAAYAHTNEPLIREHNTIGLATWPEAPEAYLRGALEVIERESYMVMWLNQLTLPRLRLDSVKQAQPHLSHLLDHCARYKLKPHFVPMLTDAPTYAMCTVLEDLTGNAPRFTLGLKAHRQLAQSIEGSLLEALRARRSYRLGVVHQNTWTPETPVEKIGHIERLYYWAHGDNAHGLEFLIAGKEQDAPTEPWEYDTSEQHLARIIEWCRKNDFECVSVSLSRSAVNPTPWHVEMIVMPDLQPTYLLEWRRQLGGSRLRTLPEQLGYSARAEPFVDAPHPYF